MTDNEVFEDVIKWVALVSGLKTIKAHQGGDRPEKPYMMVNFTNLREVREHHLDVDYETTGMQNTEGKNIVLAKPLIESEWEFSIHSYGIEPTEPFRKIRTIMRIGGGPHQGINRCLTLFDIGKIAHVPDFINNRWEPRAVSKLFVRAYTKDGFVIDVIDEATTEINRIQLIEDN